MLDRQDDTLDPEGLVLPIGFCETCGKDVVVYARPGLKFATEDIVWRCICCDRCVGHGHDVVQYETLFELQSFLPVIDDGSELVDAWFDSDGPKGGTGTGNDSI